jgi:glycosyltransferase involved in cell wall biosynthesis
MTGPSTGRQVCIVTPGYISSTPRVVREADALAAAAYDVRVVFTQGALHEVRQFDADLVRGKRWRFDVVGWSRHETRERSMHWRSGIRHRLVQALPGVTLHVPGIAERAEGRLFPELAELAAAQRADLYIGHYPAGLAAAAHAARKHAALLGYDVEDLYAEIRPDTPEWAKTRAGIIEIERRYVRSCAHISTVARPVAQEFAARYGKAPSVVVHNCHPWAERRTMDGKTLDRVGSALSLYWYSQTVGLDRGLQEAIDAAGSIGEPIQIHVRGAVSDFDRQALTNLAASRGIERALHFHELVTPDALLSRAAEHDVGLALETPVSINRGLTVTNKLCLYLTAGLAVAASDLAGQRAVLESCPDAGFLYPSGDARALAAHLAEWARNPLALTRAKDAALRAARDRWNLEAESERLVKSIDALFVRRQGCVA